MIGGRSRGPGGVGGRLTATRVTTARTGQARIRARPMPRSISAPTIAVCWSRARPATASASSMRSPASSGSGEGVSTSGRISEAAIGRAVEALAICRDKMRNRGVTRARLIATEACRAAANGAEFRARIAEEVGLELEIIDRETEADAGRHRLHAADRSAGRGRHPVRHRRRLVGAGAARPLAAEPLRSAAAADQGLGVAAGRRGDARRAPRRPRWSPARSTRR